MQQGCFHSVIAATSFPRPSWHTLASHNAIEKKLQCANQVTAASQFLPEIHKSAIRANEAT
jgi:hypothetical protein